MIRTCKICEQEKDINDFYNRGNYFTYTCKICLSEKQKTYEKSQVKYSKEYYRESAVRLKYGLTEKEYNKIYKDQNGKCAICGMPESELKKKLCVDHDHKTGKVRGLLCTLCNQALGSFKDNQSNIENALYYLILNK